MTREEEINAAEESYANDLLKKIPDNIETSFKKIVNVLSFAKKSFRLGAKWADEHPINPWRPVTEMPTNKWLWCRQKDEPESLPYIAKLDSESGQCFTLEDMELVSPDYWMPIPPLEKE